MFRADSPFLTGEDAARAREALAALAQELRASEGTSEGREENRDSDSRMDWPSLAGGDAGLGLFYAYLALSAADEADADRWADEAIRFLDRSAEALSSSVTPPSFYSGFTGVAWTMEHLDGRLFENEEDGQETIDEVVLEFLDSEAASAEFDIIQGLAGFGVYALERGSLPTAEACLERVIRSLGARATRDERGVRWFSPPERLPEHQREQYPEGNVNAGAAHGLPGVLPVLAGAAEAGVAESEARELLEGAVTWMLDHRLDPDPETGSRCHLPYAWLASGEAGGAASRLAWCYGDPGAAASLLCAARQVGRKDWEEEAIRMALDAAQRPPSESGIQDAGLCHGAAGLAHLYHRFSQAHDDPRLAETARFWFRWTLDFRDQKLRDGEGAGVAGFPAWASEPGQFTGKLSWRDDSGFLTGAAGVGLALLAAIGDLDPAWDRILGVTLPPPPGEDSRE